MTEDVSSAEATAADGKKPSDETGMNADVNTKDVSTAEKVPAPPQKRTVDRRSFFSW